MLRRYLVAKISGIFLMFFSLSMLTPVIIAWYFQNGDNFPFYLAFSITLSIGFILWLPTRDVKANLNNRDGFIIVLMMWLLLSLFGSLPFMISHEPHISFTAAFFETVSGLTTTGATTIPMIDDLPQSILYYRQQLQFLGGMGIIVLAVAIMPIIGVGGMQLYRAEASGIQKDNKVAPRITQAAKVMWKTYLALTAACALSFWALGMSPFNALCYAFSTLSTGGYATHSASIAHYNSTPIYLTCMFFMLMGGINFSLHVLMLYRGKTAQYWRDIECRTFLFIMLFSSLLFAAVLHAHGNERPLLHAAFQIISFGTSTGFITDSHYAIWPSFLPIGLMFIATMGACAGSTTGGIKIIRVMLIFRLIRREIKRLIHPNGVFFVKLGDQTVDDQILNSVWAFLGAYALITCILWLCLISTGIGVTTSFSAIVTCISNTGPGLGGVSQDFSDIPATAQLILSFAMLCGRLEVFTVLVLFSRTFWKG